MTFFVQVKDKTGWVYPNQYVAASPEDITDEMVAAGAGAVEEVDAMDDSQIAALLETDGYAGIIARAVLTHALQGTRP